MIISPFAPVGLGFTVTAGVASQSTQIMLAKLSASGKAQAQPTHIKLLNKGSADIWFSFTQPAGAAVAIPVPGTTDVGTPGGCFLEPGVDQIFTINCGWGTILSTTTGLVGASPGFYLNTIAGAAAQSLYCQLGEGA